MATDIIARGMASKADSKAQQAIDELSMVVEGRMNAEGTVFTDLNGNVVVPDTETVYQDVDTYVYYRYNGSAYYIVSDPRNTVRYTVQTVTEEEQAQARQNIGAQEELTSGVNIKTINNNSILEGGDLELVDLSSVQTITGVKTLPIGTKVKINNSYYYEFTDDNFGQLGIKRNGQYGITLDGNTVRGISGLVPQTNNTNDLGTSFIQWKDLYLGGKAYIGASSNTIYEDSSQRLVLTYQGSDRIKIGSANTVITNRLDPDNDNVQDIGRSTVRWKDAYFAGQVYAQNIFNIINASDIVDNTLTQAQYDLITNGKPTMIKGSFGGLLDAIFYPPNQVNDWTLLDGYAIGNNPSGRGFGWVYQYRITVSTKAIVVNTAIMKLDSGSGLLQILGLSNGIDIGSNATNVKIKGKQLPNYPSNIGKFSFQYNDGSLVWEETIKEDFSSQISLDNESSLTILRKECSLIKKGSSVKLHIYISGKNESETQVTGVRFANSGVFTISTSAIADAIKDMGGNAISSSDTSLPQIKTAVQAWYNDGNGSTDILRITHSQANQITLYSPGYAASINAGANFIVSIDEVLAI